MTKNYGKCKYKDVTFIFNGVNVEVCNPNKPFISYIASTNPAEDIDTIYKKAKKRLEKEFKQQLLF